jgi:hypothetical protein
MVEHFSTTLNVHASGSEQLAQPAQPARKRGNKDKSRTKQQKKSDRNEKYAGWQGVPALFKLHNIAVWLQASSLHSDLWDDAVGIRLGIDNTTRWSSWYKVIDNALKKRAQIAQFITDHDTALGDDVLTGSDWELLSKTHLFLQPFASATLYAEGKSSSVSQSLVLMDVLLKHYENARVGDTIF